MGGVPGTATFLCDSIGRWADLSFYLKPETVLSGHNFKSLGLQAYLKYDKTLCVLAMCAWNETLNSNVVNLI